MREIKFRAWNIENKEFVKDDYYNQERVVKLYYQENYLIHPSIYELSQYTGLKDKNSKEIYEGDIVGLSNGTSYKYMVVFAFGCFMVRNKDGICRNLYEIVDPEVIGNIYENPELLNE